MSTPLTNSQLPSIDQTWYRWVKLSRVYIFAGSMLTFWPVGKSWAVTMSAYSLSLPLLAYAQLMIYGLFGAAVLHRWYMGLVAIFPLPGIYPLMKRITYWPQAWLGVAVNFPAAVTIMALRPNATMSATMLVIAGWCWTLHYDTIYGSQDKKDDVKAGVKSTALLFGHHARYMLTFFSSLMLACLATAGMLNEQNVWFYGVSVGGAALHFFYQIFSVDTESPQSCLKFFESNAWQLGGIIWAGLFLDYLLA
ncbi:hypothetical protein VNI00_009961 [Paramarasmius palmivorus]|uniref:4-hydroxybenzoate octaprenyltransferase n=1 Tax=Paramarasmius palmivorus TaxID=297713 RepID=A0AAW0CMR0_9AGAR